LVPSGYITTGNIRYGTLEPKNFKRLLGRGDFTYGSMTLETVDKDGVEYDHISYDSSVPPIEVGTNLPATAQEYVAYKFILYRDGTTSSLGPVFKGYQAKATIATPRQRIIQFPVYCYDVETDRYNVVTGYEGRAFDKIQALEDIEESDFNIKIKILLDKKSFLDTTVTVKPTGQMGENLSAKIKFLPIDSFNLSVVDKKLNRPKEEDNED
jgi:hypothetical protein